MLLFLFYDAHVCCTVVAGYKPRQFSREPALLLLLLCALPGIFQRYCFLFTSSRVSFEFDLCFCGHFLRL